MLSNLNFIEETVRQRHRAFEKEAQTARMIRMAGHGKPRALGGVLEGLADVLIYIGQQIKSKYAVPETVIQHPCRPASQE